MSSLFKRKGLGPSQSAPYSNHEFADGERADGQVDELDDYHQDESAGYEHDDFDNEPMATTTDNPQQFMPQPTQPMPMKKIFPTSPAPMTATTVPAQLPTPTPAPGQPASVPVVATTAVTKHEMARPQETNTVQMTSKIDRVLHGRLRYLSFKTGKTQAALVEEFIRQHCPEVP